MFHGRYLWTTKNSKKATVRKSKPFIFFMHKKMVAQRSRFVSKVSESCVIVASIDNLLSLALILKSLLAMILAKVIIASIDFKS